MWIALTAEFRRQWLEFRRYPTESVSELAVIVIVFYGLFLGASYVSGGSLVEGRLDSVIIGYMLWTLAISALGSMGWQVMNEAQNGTLEQVMLNPIGPVKIMLIRNIAMFSYNVLFVILVLFSIMGLTGRHLSISVFDLVPFLLAVMSAMGIGYYVASLTILFKRSNQFLGLLQFVLLFMVMTPFTSLPGAWRDVAILVPIAPMKGMLGMMMGDVGANVATLAWWSIVNAIFWLGTGTLVFSKAVSLAKRRGILGHY